MGRRRQLLASVAGILLAQSALATAPQSQAEAPAPSASAQRWKYFPSPPQAPKGAPNILLVLTDDVGFAASSTYGGPVPTPAFDRVARTGLRYNQFNTAAMCSPTRAALLTGRNHHAVGYGSINNVAVDEPGYTSVIPRSAATIARVLADNGYDTAMFGKNHNTPEWELGPLGPFDRWPNGLGFNYFYGFNAAMTDQRSPELIENRNSLSPSNTPDYYLDRDLADRLIHWLSVQGSIHSDHPFFAYLAPGAMHEPQQAPPEWIARFKGKFDKGWDVIREESFARQRAMGIVPANATLTPRPAYIPAWSSLPAPTQKLYARMMEVGAAQLAYMDDQFGRVLDALERSGQLDNTLIIYVQGDNGASEEYEFGDANYLLVLTDIVETAESILPDYAKIGSADFNGQYPAGWAWAMNTPFPESKQIASHLGGLRAGLAISWPKRIKDRGAIRQQFSHVIDIAPTIYEAIGITPPKVVDGIEQQPIEGTSMVYSFEHPNGQIPGRGQYFEMLGNRAFYEDGWLASTLPPVPPFTRDTSRLDPSTYKWALFDLNRDYSQSVDVSAKFPDKLRYLKSRFGEAARRDNVYPLNANYFGRFDSNLRPSNLDRAKLYRFLPGDTRYPMSTFPSMSPQWIGTAKLNCAAGTSDGPLYSLGTRFSGAKLWLEKGMPNFVYDPTGRPQERVHLKSSNSVGLGAHNIQIRFTRDESKRTTLNLFVDGSLKASAEVPKVYPIVGQSLIGRPQIDAEPLHGEASCKINSFEIEKPE